MEKKFELTLLLSESEIDVLLDSLSMDESVARELSDKHLDEISDFGEFLQSKGLNPDDNLLYQYHKGEAEHFNWKAETLGGLFDEISDAVSNSTTVFYPRFEVKNNV